MGEQRAPVTLEPGDTLTDRHGGTWVFVRWDGHKLVVRRTDAFRTFYAGAVGVRDPRLAPGDE